MGVRSQCRSKELGLFLRFLLDQEIFRELRSRAKGTLVKFSSSNRPRPEAMRDLGVFLVGYNESNSEMPRLY